MIAKRICRCIGRRSLKIDRKAGGTIFVERAALSITGCVPPAVLRATLSQDDLEAGLAARLLIVEPPRREKKWSEAGVSEQAAAALSQVIEKLYALDFTTDQVGNPCPVVLGLTMGARQAYREWYARHNAVQVRLSGALAAAWSKLEAIPCRLALVLALADNPLADAVGEEWMQAGIALADWFANEAHRHYARQAQAAEADDRQSLIELIQRRAARSRRAN